MGAAHEEAPVVERDRAPDGRCHSRCRCVQQLIVRSASATGQQQTSRSSAAHGTTDFWPKTGSPCSAGRAVQGNSFAASTGGGRSNDTKNIPVVATSRIPGGNMAAVQRILTAKVVPCMRSAYTAWGFEMRTSYRAPERCVAYAQAQATSGASTATGRSGVDLQARTIAWTMVVRSR